MKFCIGLVVKGGKQFIKDWIKCAEKISDIILVVDNGADKEVRDILINHKSVKRYVIQKGLERNQSRDYQQILEMAREENCQWVWNLDIDEYVKKLNTGQLFESLLNWEDDSVGLPLLEMRGDKEHYVMIQDLDGTLKHARLVHKIYKTLSHFEFDKKDAHGRSIPHNCKAGGLYFLPIKHFGHMTKKLRDEKRKIYIDMGFKDEKEQESIWMEEDESKIEVRKWKD